MPFDSDWHFLKGDAAGAEKPEFDDGKWRKLNVPHDWSIEGPFDEKNPTGPAGGYLPAGVGWYRKHFALSSADAKRPVFIDFDGVMANSDVWINGVHLGKRPYGYVSFRYELTGHLKFGKDGPNVLAVRADNSGQPASRWYAGAGIYRHVRLDLTSPIHLDHWATFVSTPKVSSAEAIVRIDTDVVNQSSTPGTVALLITLLGPNGETVAKAETLPQSVAAGRTVRFQHDITVAEPKPWDVYHPPLYRALVRVRSGKSIVDEETVTFGIRDFRFDAATGFWLNGKNLKIKGVCLHHDGGAVGSAVPLRVWERRLTTLKEIGVNAIRTAHNPPAPEFLDLTDRMGFIVMDELFDQWTLKKNPYDYHLHFREWSQIDVRDTVRRDRNHPSVFIYSAGNEIRDTTQPDVAKGILRSLLDAFHRADSTRAVTQGLFRPNVSHDYDNGLADMLDVVGQNYRENEMLAAHAAKPARKILGTENRHEREVWLALRDNPPYAGQFLWTGIDYLGEAHAWPEIASDFGLLDRTGGFKPRAYERQSWWSHKPMVHIVRRVAPREVGPTDPGYGDGQKRQAPKLFSDWTPADTSPHAENVEVYSNCEQVELFLNGKSMGTKARPADDSSRNWTVPFEPGTIRAECRIGGTTAATHELRTAGKPARIVLDADRTQLWPNWDHVSHLTATVVDEQGVPVPNADSLISFKVNGPGEIVAVDNADNTSHEPFQARERRAFQGRCIAIVRATAKGRIVVAASSPGIAGGSATITAHALHRP